MTLEEEMLRSFEDSEDIPLERALLIVSGVSTEEEVSHYVGMLDSLEEKFRDYERWFRSVDQKSYFEQKKPEIIDNLDYLITEGLMKRKEGNFFLLDYTNRAVDNFFDYHDQYSAMATAFILHDFLWHKKSRRSYSQQKFSFTEILKRQSSNEDLQVGDCFELTSLYVTSGLRLGLNLGVCNLESMDENEEHMMPFLADGNKKVLIESRNKVDFKVDNVNAKQLASYYSPAHLVSYVYHLKSIQERDAGNFDQAIKENRKALLVNPRFAAAYRERADLAFDIGDYQSAIRIFNISIQHNPNNPWTWHNLAVAYENNNELENALQACNKAIDINPLLQFYAAKRKIEKKLKQK